VSLIPNDKLGNNRCALPGDTSPTQRQCAFIYDCGQPVAFVAEPAEGSTLDRWGGICDKESTLVCAREVFNFDEVRCNFKPVKKP
jgi:hypothetical protein